jgi:hypothetical protein
VGSPRIPPSGGPPFPASAQSASRAFAVPAPRLPPCAVPAIACPSPAPARRPPRAKLIPGRADLLRSAESNPRTSPPARNPATRENQELHKGPKHRGRQAAPGDENGVCSDEHTGYVAPIAGDRFAARRRSHSQNSPICGQCASSAWSTGGFARWTGVCRREGTA